MSDVIGNATKLPPAWLVGGVALLTFIAIGDLPYGYFQFLRIVVTAYAAYLVYAYAKRPPAYALWIFALVAILYNPIFVITMEKGTHAVFNLATSGVILTELYVFRKLRDGSGDPETDQGALDQNGRASERTARLDRARRIVLRSIAALVTVIVLGVGTIIGLNYRHQYLEDREAAAAAAEIAKISFQLGSNAMLCSGNPDRPIPISIKNGASKPVAFIKWSVFSRDKGHSSVHFSVDDASDQIIPPGGSIEGCTC